MRVAKVLVAGAGEAGKSTLIQALVPDAMNLEVRGRTIAMDHATLVCGGDRYSIVGVPGQERFGTVREVLAEGANGVIWVHRAGCATDPETTALLRGLTDRDVPYLVLINHTNGGNGRHGWSLPVGLPGPETIIECDLWKPEGVLSRLREEIRKLIRWPASRAEKGA